MKLQNCLYGFISNCSHFILTFVTMPMFDSVVNVFIVVVGGLISLNYQCVGLYNCFRNPESNTVPAQLLRLGGSHSTALLESPLGNQ